MGEQQSYYAVIPANVRYDNELSANAKLLYGEITCLCNKEGYCWASNGYFAKLYNVSKVTVSRWITQLKEKGYIHLGFKVKDESTVEQVRTISIVNTPYQKCYGGLNKNDKPPLNKNDKDNNTSMNNTREDICMGAKPHKPRKQFIPPSLEEVEAYAAEKGYGFNAKAFIDYYEASDWHLSNGKKVTNWKKCCATWGNNANRYVVSKQKKQPTQADYDEWIKELEEDEIKQG